MRVCDNLYSGPVHVNLAQLAFESGDVATACDLLYATTISVKTMQQLQFIEIIEVID